MANNPGLVVNPGDDLFKIAAIYYGDASYWSQIAQANNLYDPMIQQSLTLVMPTANKGRANDGAWSSP